MEQKLKKKNDNFFEMPKEVIKIKKEIKVKNKIDYVVETKAFSIPVLIGILSLLTISLLSLITFSALEMTFLTILSVVFSIGCGSLLIYNLYQVDKTIQTYDL